MTLDEAIKHANDVAYLQDLQGCKECAADHLELALWLEELKQLREQTRWIPVSERLPEDRREVLVTAYWHETYQVMMALYYGDGLWWCVPFNNCGEHMQRLNPKAWMPLPQPYTAESKVKFTNSEWIDFLSEQFQISRTSAKEMLHVMMSVKKEDNLKKQFSQQSREIVKPEAESEE